jgi:hypothetical protein
MIGMVEMMNRLSKTSRILSLFNQSSELDCSDIAGTLLIAPSVVDMLCNDLVRSGVLRQQISDDGRIIYVATDKLLSHRLIYDSYCGEEEENISIRPEIINFARAMEKTMRENDETQGDKWKRLKVPTIENMLYDEIAELKRVKGNNQVELNDMVDIATLLMMLWYRGSNQ